MKFMSLRSGLISLLMLGFSNTYAATLVDLSQKSPEFLQGFIAPNKMFASPAIEIKTIKSETDFKTTLHTRIKQMYAGLPVWGADAVIHTPQSKTKSLTALLSDKQ